MSNPSKCRACRRKIEPHGVTCVWCGWDPADPATLDRGKQRAALLRSESHTPATLDRGETLAIPPTPCQPGSVWYQVAILDSDGRRVALAFYHPGLDLLVDRVSVWT